MWVHLLGEYDDLGLRSLSRTRFRELVGTYRVVPVVRKVGLGERTPVEVYRALARNRPGIFLLESSQDTRTWSRWSYVGCTARPRLRPSTARPPGRERHWRVCRSA
ncbi:MAG: hypothetical protein JO281_06740 [Pseudonocardiales bacterium]|nr:hypothetical protein [Pseudonocardiales bacterium]